MIRPLPIAPTPTPYRLDVDLRSTSDYHVRIVPVAEGVPTVALIVQPDYCIGNEDNSAPLARAKATGEFMVRACNSHAGLVDACSAVSDDSRLVCNLTTGEKYYPLTVQEMSALRQALAQAKATS